MDASGEFDRDALASAFNELPDGVWRVKGFLLSNGRPSLLQYTMGQLEIADSEPRERAYLVVIGTALERDAVESVLLAARREPH